MGCFKWVSNYWQIFKYYILKHNPTLFVVPFFYYKTIKGDKIMNDLIIDTVFDEMTCIPKEPINTQYKFLNNELSKCDKGSIITFSGTMCSKLFLNLVKQFAIDHKNCLYLQDNFYQKRFFMELITLNSDNNDFEKSKNVLSQMLLSKK